MNIRNISGRTLTFMFKGKLITLDPNDIIKDVAVFNIDDFKNINYLFASNELEIYDPYDDESYDDELDENFSACLNKEYKKSERPGDIFNNINFDSEIEDFK